MTRHWDKVPEEEKAKLRARVLEVSEKARRRAEQIRNRPWIKAVLAHSVTVECVDCHIAYHVRCGRDQLERWLDGETIQRVLPELSAGDRELLMSGFCNNCFDKLCAEGGGR